jgi:hypothetical protein
VQHPLLGLVAALLASLLASRLALGATAPALLLPAIEIGSLSHVIECNTS